MQYESNIPSANINLRSFTQDLDDCKQNLTKFEEFRCEQVHSSINQFVVFEKFAEMNNKYDVKNFSKLIDEFKLENEVETIQKSITKEME